MRRFELGIDLNYVSSWGISQAVREVFQNALDEEIQNPQNKWHFKYDKDSKTLRIGNKLSRLSTQSLLLGCSSKQDDEKTIGQHGEGYKVATIVLLRNGCNVKIYNYNEKEIWTAKIIKSKRYNAEIGVYDVEEMGVFKSIPEHSLVFEITNISEDDFEEIKESNLWVQDDLGKVINSKRGRVLLEERYKGKVFVRGLYVCDKKQLSYGYDFNRGLIDSFNLQYQLGKLLSGVEDIDFLKKVKDLWDGYYLRCFSFYFNEQKLSELSDFSFSTFKNKYGDDAVPCTSTDEFNRLKQKGYNVALVSENDYFYITKSTGYVSVEAETSSTLDDLSVWFNKIKKFLPDDLATEGSDLIAKVANQYS